MVGNCVRYSGAFLGELSNIVCAFSWTD